MMQSGQHWLGYDSPRSMDGSSTSLLMIMNMAATQFRLTVDEIIPSVTREAARALGRLDRVGTLSAGKWCDLAIRKCLSFKASNELQTAAAMRPCTKKSPGVKPGLPVTKGESLERPESLDARYYPKAQSRQGADHLRAGTGPRLER